MANPGGTSTNEAVRQMWRPLARPVPPAAGSQVVLRLVWEEEAMTELPRPPMTGFYPFKPRTFKPSRLPHLVVKRGKWCLVCPEFWGWGVCGLHLRYRAYRDARAWEQTLQVNVRRRRLKAMRGPW